MVEPRRSARLLAARTEKYHTLSPLLRSTKLIHCRPAAQTSSKPPRPFPPRSLLNSAWGLNKTIAVRNAAKSPLLRLPAEIRLRIYHYALGGKEIHVGAHIALRPSRTSRRIAVCHKETSEWDHISHIRHGGHNLEYDNWTRHRLCNEACIHIRKRGLCLGMLMVCMQIHHEAALFPFSSNTFLITNDESMRVWQASLAPVQLRAVRSLILLPDFSPWMIHITRIKALPALHRLGLYLEMTVRGAGHTAEEAARLQAKRRTEQYGCPRHLIAKEVIMAIAICQRDGRDFTRDRQGMFQPMPSSTDEACASLEEMISSRYKGIR